MITKISEHFLFHYPATLSNVQISCETTSNITRYLDNWLFCTTKKNLFNRSTTFLYLLCLSYLIIH